MNENKTIILTGCLGGLGNSIASNLKNKSPKYRIIGIDIKEDPTTELLNVLDEYIYSDLSKGNLIYRTINEVLKNKTGKMHLVNNAGVMTNDTILQKDWGNECFERILSRWNKTIEINLTACYLLSICFSNALYARRAEGSIIHISSISANGNPGQSSYSASKGGLRSLSKTLSKELGPIGIRSNCILPGFINTEATSNALQENLLKKRIRQTPLHRLGQPNEVASIVRELIENEFLNGCEVNIDGGLSI